MFPAPVDTLYYIDKISSIFFNLKKNFKILFIYLILESKGKDRRGVGNNQSKAESRKPESLISRLRDEPKPRSNTSLKMCFY